MPLTKDNYLDIKYIIIHELVHIVQFIRAKVHVKDYTVTDKIKYMMRRSTISELENMDKSTYFSYLIYREDIHEISAWGNNAYIEAFKLKKENPDMSNNKIMQQVLTMVKMDTSYLNKSIDNIRNEDVAYMAVIGMLIGQFSELNGNNEQSYFDKSVFQLPVVKNMKKDIKQILNSFASIHEISDQIIKLIYTYDKELQENKHIIIESFITHLKYWFKRARVKLGKAIQLGIEDAEILINKNHIITEHHKLSSKEIFKKLYNI